MVDGHKVFRERGGYERYLEFREHCFLRWSGGLWDPVSAPSVHSIQTETRTFFWVASPFYLGELSWQCWFHFDVYFPCHTLLHSKISFHRFIETWCIFLEMMRIRHDHYPLRGFGHWTPIWGYTHSTSLFAIEKGCVWHMMPQDQWGPRVQPSLNLAVVFGFVLFRVCFLTHMISPDRAPHQS